MDSIDQLSIEALERIDQICCEFEKELKQGHGKGLQHHLAGVAGYERSTLLFELLVLEIDYRRRRGQTILPGDYEAMFPEECEAIEKAFASSQPQNQSSQVEAAMIAARDSATTDRIQSPHITSIGRYRVLAPLASGGFGIVYRGFDEELQRDVAIKVPHRSVISDGRHAERFLAEARLTANLNHPGIVPVYDVGRTEMGECYVVAKFMEGGDLSAKLRRAKPEPAEAAAIVAQIADALHCAHEQRLVHRDIKPSNILMDANGGVYLADFGAAVQESTSSVIGFVGTPAYMSPEQARGEGHRVDIRTDIFALGVVLYELMTGVRPFHSQSVTQLLADIIGSDPVLPRQINTAIPAELERICLKAMSKRATDRYPTAREFCWDLRAWSDEVRQTASNGSQTPLPVVPKGLRSFDVTDSDFFLQLLAGPRDKRGLPESIRFWQARIEAHLPHQGFRVGVIYGPSGSGKSSLIKAGCLPRLSRTVRPLYVEAHARDTEEQLRHALREICGSDGELADQLRKIRNGSSPGAAKVLIVIDQFEQWLHAQDDLATASLTAALRQCDGVSVQCLLLVRDDFWMPLVRLMVELEVPLVDGENTMAVDLFNLGHAKKVLCLFGQAYERLPANLHELTGDQKRFLREGISLIQHDGSVSPIRLSLFAEMMKNEVWEPATLRRMGGAEGLGLAYLDRCFGRPETPRPNRLHAAAARQVLKSLLPEPSVHIRGHFLSAQELAADSGYGDQPHRFEDLLRLLDQTLRLITPVDPDSDQPISDVRQRPADPSAGKRYYQLTHDFMVDPIREWVTQEQRQSLRGRAELCLAQRAALWTARPEGRQLPGFLECARILALTEPRRWTDPQRKMLRYAARRNLLRGLLAIFSVAIFLFVTWHTVGRIRAKSALATVRSADTQDLMGVIGETEAVRRWLTPLLQKEIAGPTSDKQALHRVRLALLRDDPQQATALYDAALSASPEELRVIRDGLLVYSDEESRTRITQGLWATLDDDDIGTERRFRAACLLAAFDPTSLRWPDYSEDIVLWLAAKPVDEVPDWLDTLRPVSAYLVDDITTLALAEFLEDADHPRRVIELIKRARPSQLPALVNTLRKRRSRAVELLKTECEATFATRDEVVSADLQIPPTPLVEKLTAAKGFITPQFAVCQTLPMHDIADMIKSLRQYKYRPIRVRPFRHDGQLLVAAIWKRDAYDWVAEVGISADRFRQLDVERSQDRLGIDELAAYSEDGHWKLIAVWSGQADALLQSRVSLMTPRRDWQTDFDTNATARFQPRTYQLAVDENGDVRRTQIWRPITTRGWYNQRTFTTGTQLSNSLRHYVPADVSLFLGWGSRPYGLVLEENLYVASETIILDSPDELLTQWASKYQNGFAPVAISVVSSDDRDAPRSVTVWQRNAPTEEARQKFADVKANIAIALLLLGESETVLPHLSHAADPTLRYYLIERMGPARVPVNVYRTNLDRADLAADVRQSLVLALGSYSPTSIPPDQRSELAQSLLRLFQTHMDAGVHSATAWLLRRWNVELPPRSREAAQTFAHRDWLITSSGQVMVVLDYPNEYAARGVLAPPANHRFAIATTEVTAEHFHNFLASHPPHQASSRHPAHSMDWYTAAAYCNWLSERENIPESDWCYEPNEAGAYAAGMVVPRDFLTRQGYRLALSSEWLYAASAGSESRYFFGNDPELLDDYGWFRDNSEMTLHPVGLLRPNRFGLFDVYGNVKEWTHNLQTEQPEDVQISDGDDRCVLGGSFAHIRRQFRVNYMKHGNPPQLREQLNGFRIARTIVSSGP